LRLYEGMFLLDSGRAGKDWDGARAEVEALLEKHGGEIVQAGRWDERKLAYEIKGHRRATYMLAYFNAPPNSIPEIRRDCGLNDLVLRIMILARREDYPIPEDLGKTPAIPVAEATPTPASAPAPAPAPTSTEKEG
jgi:small subunit ribosomal protein S6